MQHFEKIEIETLSAKTCDRCGRHATIKDIDLEYQEFLSINHHVGYSSVFGDTNQISMDLCQHCVKEVLGQWVTVTEESFIGELI